jgi:hypothetical protein
VGDEDEEHDEEREEHGETSVFGLFLKKNLKNRSN